MGIDGIGGSGPPGPRALEPGAGGAGAPAGGVVETGKSSGLAEAGAAEAGATEAAGRPEGPVDVDRARLERGELGVDEYLDLQVERATAHLADKAPAAALDLVRSELRQQLAADPLLRSLSERLVGGRLAVPEGPCSDDDRLRPGLSRGWRSGEG